MIERKITYQHSFIGQQFIAKLDFTSQYHSLYCARLKSLKYRCISADESGYFSLSEIMEVKVNQSCLIAGIIVCTYADRSSIVEKYISKIGILADRKQSTFYNRRKEEDFIYLEDESGRVRLDLKQYFDWENLITGLVVAVRGVMRENSVLEVIEIFYPSADPPRPLLRKGDEFICFISGIEIGNPSLDPILLNLLSNFLQGNLGNDSAEVAKNIVRFVILGNSLYKADKENSFEQKAYSDISADIVPSISKSLEFFDTFLAELAGILPVDLIPGEMDPSNSSMPQQPLNPYLFPLASRYSALRSFPNPYECKIDGIHILCTSGQNINAIMQFIDTQDPIKILELTMKWRHLAPNAPDALGCIPMQDDDPFIVEDLPNLYVVGGMPNYQKLVTEEGVHCITIPKFTSRQQVVLVNRFTMESETLSFVSVIQGMNNC
ncbi:unnamed protein product [Blepharisma stoltei]|uniref:DNA polymerase delta small subunit n=1 Tax=Blepharisma stoltei TaxID=1481888 RepID=A0AAU9IHB7_9CILI|nr:unnamed protein product [Blepharisma stoltei]